MNTRRQCSTSGFTLVEVLVVIGIIAVLAAILFPVMARAKESAKAVACLSNMSQIGKAVMLYLPDFDDTYPMNRLPDPANGIAGCTIIDFRGSPFNWRHTIFPYVKDYKVRACPTNRFAWGTLTTFWGTADGDEANAYYPASQRVPRGYAYNGGFFHEVIHICDRFGVSRPRTASEINDAPNLILLLESRMSMPDLGDWILGSRDCYPPTGVGCFNPGLAKKMSWTFADGHSKAMRLARTVAPQQMWTDNPADQPRIEGLYAQGAATWHEY